jgi:hypothetical protein
MPKESESLPSLEELKLGIAEQYHPQILIVSGRKIDFSGEMPATTSSLLDSRQTTVTFCDKFSADSMNANTNYLTIKHLMLCFLC